MTENIEAKIESWHRAHTDPEAAGVTGIQVAITGQMLEDPDLLLWVEPRCKRCVEKNTKRCEVNASTRYETLEHGDRVTFHAVFDEGDANILPHWRTRPLYHRRHSQLNWSDVVSRGTHQVRCEATLHDGNTDDLRLVGVEVIEHSPASHGPEHNLTQTRRFEQWDDWVTAEWPQTELEWLDQLAESS